MTAAGLAFRNRDKLLGLIKRRKSDESNAQTEIPRADPSPVVAPTAPHEAPAPVDPPTDLAAPVPPGDLSRPVPPVAGPSDDAVRDRTRPL